MIQIVRYRPESLSVVQTIQTGEPLFSLAFSPDGLWLAAGVSGAVRVYRVIDWAFYARLPVDGDVLSLAQVSRRLAAGTSTGFLYYWAKNLGPGFRLEQSIALRRNQIDQQLFMAPVNSLAASQAFYRIGHGLGDGLWVLDAADGATRTRVSFQPDYWIDNLLTTLAFTPDGRYILCRQYGGTFTLWHISGALLRQVIVPTGPTTSVAISPDSRLAAMGGDRLNLWIIPSLERIKTEAANTPVVSVAFSPDGRLIITLGADHTLRAWGISLY
jgi:WD40 repeat protein